MKIGYFVLLLLATSIQFGTSQETQVDTSFIYDWNGIEWINTRYNTRDWLNEQDYVRYRHDLQEDGTYAISDKIEFNFDDQGNYSRWYSQSYDTLINDWVNRSLTLYTFNELNQELIRESSIWNKELEIWEKNEKTESYYTDEHNELDYFIKYKGNEEDEWTYNFSFFHSYFFEGGEIDSSYSRLHRVNEIDTLPYDAKKYIYDTDGLLSIYRNHRVGSDDTILSQISRYNYFYDQNGLLEIRKVALRNNSGEIEPRYEYHYEYYDDEKIKSQCAFHSNGSTLTNDWKISYKYSLLPSSTKDVIPLDVDITWNNSSLGQLNIDINNTRSSSDLRCYLIHQSGQIQKSLKISQNQIFNTSYSLPPGMYALTLVDSSGKVKAEKIIVH